MPAAPMWSATGIAGATAGARFVGATLSGAPTTGPFLRGDYVVDHTGQMWVCTVAGSPGTWVAPGSGRELGYAEITTSPPPITAADVANRIDVTGVTITVAVTTRPIVVEAYVGSVSNDTADRGAGIAIVEGSTLKAQAIGHVALAGGVTSLHAKARLAPSAGYHTYKMMAWRVAGGTVTFTADAVSLPIWIQAVEV